jgi:hypothetical protein
MTTNDVVQMKDALLQGFETIADFELGNPEVDRDQYVAALGRVHELAGLLDMWGVVAWMDHMLDEEAGI